jgi:hypothetical protein
MPPHRITAVVHDKHLALSTTIVPRVRPNPSRCYGCKRDRATLRPCTRYMLSERPLWRCDNGRRNRFLQQQLSLLRRRCRNARTKSRRRWWIEKVVSTFGHKAKRTNTICSIQKNQDGIIHIRFRQRLRRGAI